MKGLRIATVVEIDGKFYSTPSTAAQKLADKLCWNVYVWGKYNRNRCITPAQKKRAFRRVKPIAEKMFANIEVENSKRPSKYLG